MLGLLLVWTADYVSIALLIYTATTVGVVRGLHVCPALICGLETILLPNICRSVHLLALGAEVKAASSHIASELHELVDRIVHSFDPIRIVDGELGIVWSLDAF